MDCDITNSRRAAASRIVSEPIVSLIHCPTFCTCCVQKCRETYVGYATPRYESSGVCQLQMPRDGAALGDFRAIHTCKTLGDQSDHGGLSSNCLHPRIVGSWEGRGGADCRGLHPAALASARGGLGNSVRCAAASLRHPPRWHCMQVDYEPTAGPVSFAGMVSQGS